MAQSSEVSRPPLPLIEAFVMGSERPMVEAASRLLSECLGAATGDDRRFRAIFRDAVRSDVLDPSGPQVPEEVLEQGPVPVERRDYRDSLVGDGPRIVVLSLLADVIQTALHSTLTPGRFVPSPEWERGLTDLQKDWISGHFVGDPPIEVEAAAGHWRSICSTLLAGRGGVEVFLCNVFRSVPGGVPHRYYGGPETLGERLRRFNLLAAEVSHETGVCIVDLDRALAHVGASALGTDYRLAGPHAAEAGAFALVAAILWSGLGDAYDPDAIATAQVELESRRAAWERSIPDADEASDHLAGYVPYLRPSRASGRLQKFVASDGLSLEWGVRRVVREFRDGRLDPLRAAGMILEKTVGRLRRR